MARRSMKWYKKLISYFLQLAMLNGYVLYSLEVKKMPFLNFVRDVSKTAVPEICHDCFFFRYTNDVDIFNNCLL